jgi:bifunctional oligoribonuclease and PAP phosphatase NrnA
MQNLVELKSLLHGAPLKIIVTTHQKPDADALGSSLALFNYLKKYNHRISVITPTDYPKFIFWMAGNNCVINFEENKESRLVSQQLISSADLIFCLDFSAYDRIGEMGEMVAKSSAQKVLIDHHLNPTIDAEYKLWDPKAAATCELIYDLIFALGDKHLLDIAIGECIYAGIMTDTGSFRFPSTSKKVHLIIAELIELGVDNSKIHRLVYDNNSSQRLKFLGFALSQKLTIEERYHCAYFVISNEELKAFNSQNGDTEGLVNYALSIEGICFAAIIIEKDDMVKLSFRSSGDFSVNEFAAKHFEGGGHKNAAGGKSALSLQKTIEKFLQILPTYTQDLSNNFNQPSLFIPC